MLTMLLQAMETASDIRRVMFVGEDREIWPDLLKRSATENWRLTFAHAADEALVAMDEQHFDAIVTDLRLRGMSGAELLHEVRQRRPEIWRFLRGDAQAAHDTKGWAGAAHQFIAPSTPEEIQDRLFHAFRNEYWMPSPVAESVLATCPILPSPPKLYYRIMDALTAPNASLEKVGELIEQDPPMAAKILKLVNSAIFSLRLEVNRAADAVLYLGIETTKSMILMAHTVSSFQAVARADFPIQTVLRHSIATARYARWISQMECPRGQTPDQAFTAGLLHDIGKFLLAGNRGEAYARAIDFARKGQVDIRHAEIDYFGTDHAELGGCLLSSWGLPQPIVEAVALHHAPRWLGESGFCPITAVHAANELVHEEQLKDDYIPRTGVSEDYLNEGGYSKSIQKWREHCHFRE